MSFRDNLLHLRASQNMTQEQLAMLLGVSRQSVTKWESEKSYPEMDKLLKICQVFDCTLDELVQGDLTGRAPDPATTIAPNTPPVDVFGYDEHARWFANRIANGVMIAVLGVALSIIFFSTGDPHTSHIVSLPENVAAAMGTMCVLAGIAYLLALVIPAGLAHSQFVREHPYLEDFYTEEQKTQARSTFTYQLIGGIALIFAGVCAVILFGDGPYEEVIGIPVMLVCIAIGVRFIVHGSMMLSRTNIAAYNMAAGEMLEAHEIEQLNVNAEQKANLMAQHRSDKRIGAVCGTIMLLATIAGLVMLFVPGYQIFWLAWPIGGMLCGIACLLIKGFATPQE